MRSIMSLFVEKLIDVLQVEPRLARPGYYNQICQSTFRYD